MLRTVCLGQKAITFDNVTRRTWHEAGDEDLAFAHMQSAISHEVLQHCARLNIDYYGYTEGHRGRLIATFLGGIPAYIQKTVAQLGTNQRVRVVYMSASPSGEKMILSVSYDKTVIAFSGWTKALCDKFTILRTIGGRPSLLDIITPPPEQILMIPR
jgi:hypothetical protein